MTFSPSLSSSKFVSWAKGLVDDAWLDLKAKEPERSYDKSQMGITLNEDLVSMDD